MKKSIFAILFLCSMTALTAAAKEKLSSKGSQDFTFVRVTTNHGSFDVALDRKLAPITSTNFLNYADAGFFNNMLFHRLVKGFVIQTGILDVNLQPKQPLLPQILSEANNGLKNLKGTLAMGRQNDNPNTATCQFFINTADNSRLDHKGETPETYGYAVFGQVVSGIEVVEEIENSAVHAIPDFASFPVKPVIIEKIERL